MRPSLAPRLKLPHMRESVQRSVVPRNDDCCDSFTSMIPCGVVPVRSRSRPLKSRDFAGRSARFSPHIRQSGAELVVPKLSALTASRILYLRGLAPPGKTGGPAVAILTHTAWQGLFRGDPRAIGSIIRVDDVRREVIGVLPEGCHFPNGNTLRSFRSVEIKKGIPEPWVFVPTVFDYAQIAWNGNYGNCAKS